VLDQRDCEECRTIGPDDAYLEIDMAMNAPDAPLRAVQLHPGDCLTKFLPKHPLAHTPERAAKRRQRTKRCIDCRRNSQPGRRA
jgi:hypothetical protein